MLAREFAAGTGAFECGAAKVDLGAIGRLAAALAFSPQGSLVAAEIGPVSRRRQLATGLGRGGIRCESQDLVGVESHRRVFQRSESMVLQQYDQYSTIIALESTNCGFFRPCAQRVAFAIIRLLFCSAAASEDAKTSRKRRRDKTDEGLTSYAKRCIISFLCC